MIIWKQWFTSVSDTGMEVYFKLAYFNEWSHSAVGQSAYVIMPNFAKIIAIPFPFQKIIAKTVLTIFYYLFCILLLVSISITCQLIRLILN